MFYQKKHIQNKSACFKKGLFAVLIFTLLPLFIFPITSRYFHQIYRCPSVSNGVIDLKGYDFTAGRSIPLDGLWEFYWKKWIVTDAETDALPDSMIPVPDTWNHYPVDEKPLPSSGYASYRMILENCPEDISLISYVPNLGAAYRVFLNGTLIAESGKLSKEPKSMNVSLFLIREQLSLALTPRSELVIEISACHVGGLNLTPILAESKSNYAWSGLRYTMTAMYLGMLILILGCFTYVLSLHKMTPESVFLLILDVIITLRILGKDEFFGILKMFLPIFRYHIVNNMMQILTIFLPAAFILWVKNLVDIYISKRTVWCLILFEILCSIPIFYYTAYGQLSKASVTYMISLLPFVIILYQLYQSIKKEIPYAFTVAVTTMFILSSLVIANQYTSGFFVMNLSLYPPTCFVIAAFLQVTIYFRKNHELRLQTIESSKLKLQLHEAETALMLSQIKPHFLYNSLIAIQVLCIREPVIASEAIGSFSNYLRANMRSISSREPIPFVQELEHVENYAAIEKLRFKERLNMTYEIGADDFTIPPLTIQPLVENAIKHGVCKKITGGTVTLRTYDDRNFIYIEVADDGIGFDVSSLKQKQDSYGFNNISFRLHTWMGADVTIQSQPDHGTQVIITIPKGDGTLERNYH